MQKKLYINDDLYLAYPDAGLIPEVFAAIDGQRSYLKEWLSWVDDVQTIRDTRNVMMENIRMNASGKKLITYIIYKGVLVGTVGMVRLDEKNKIGEIGYWLNEKEQGKGIMTKSVARLVDYIFQTMQLIRLEIRVIPENTKSGRIPLRVGFRHEVKLRSALFLNKKHYDFDIYGLLRKEWIGTG